MIIDIWISMVKDIQINKRNIYWNAKLSVVRLAICNDIIIFYPSTSCTLELSRFAAAKCNSLNSPRGLFWSFIV